MSNDDQVPDQPPAPADTVAAPPDSASGPAEPKPTETVEYWRNKARHWEGQSKANAGKARAYDDLQAQSKSDLERAQDEAKRLAERADSFRDRAVSGEAKALAGEFANPVVAVQLLGDLRGYVSADGEIDTAAITADLAALLDREPYLARTPEPAGMRPNPAQGQSGNPELTPSQRAQDRERAGDWKAAGVAKAEQLLALKHHQ